MHPEDYNQVEKGLFIGNVHAASNLNLLKKLNISHIVNLSGYEPKFPDQFFYVNIKISDTERSNIKRYFDVTNYLIASAIRGGNNVLVHCAAGISRSASICIAYLLYTHQSWTPKDAFAFLKQKRKIVQPNPGFESQINCWWYEWKSKEGFNLEPPPSLMGCSAQTQQKLLTQQEKLMLRPQPRPSKSKSH